MYRIEFYSTSDGISEQWNLLDDLQQKAAKSKDARIQHKQITLYIQLLEDHGTNLRRHPAGKLRKQNVKETTGPQGMGGKKHGYME